MNYISLHSVFATVKAALGIQDTPINISDWVEWSADALRRIGAPPQSIARITGVRDSFGVEDHIAISDYRGTLPWDFYKPIMVAYSPVKTGGYTIARKTNSAFDIRSSVPVMTHPVSGASLTYNPTDYDKYKFMQYVFNETYAESVSRLNSNQNLSTLLDTLFPANGATNGSLFGDYGYDPIFNIADPYITFNYQTGYCMLAYQALPVDENGYPLVPDNEYVVEAIKWFIEMNMLYREMRRRKEGAAQLYQHANQKWLKFKMAAYGQMMMPNGIHDMNSIAAMWLKITPRINDYVSGFAHTGKGKIG